MKNLLLLLCFCCFAGAVSAQHCEGYYYLLNNAEVEMSLYDAKGGDAGKNIYKITNVHKEGNGTASDFSSTFYDKNNKVITTSTGHFKCSGNGVAIDMKVGMPSMPQLKDMKMEAKSSETFLDYPANMHEGQELKGGSFEMAGNMNGMDISIGYAVTDRKVAGTEKITTPAGSWNCMKITYNLAFKMKMMGAGVPMNINAVEWFAPGFGVVKSASFKDGKQMGSTLITGLKK
ncbi:hypothetical protein [Chitinophaga solisilvae]|uniref:TapB family protein n=1 Tax=Chitinophaga solisilvae TaxID=1233460 RepID=UPI0013701DDE|nr:hypothetical protein [Chitinophaga solisilvae]